MLQQPLPVRRSPIVRRSLRRGYPLQRKLAWGSGEVAAHERRQLLLFKCPARDASQSKPFRSWPPVGSKAASVHWLSLLDPAGSALTPCSLGEPRSADGVPASSTKTLLVVGTETRAANWRQRVTSTAPNGINNGREGPHLL